MPSARSLPLGRRRRGRQHHPAKARSATRCHKGCGSPRTLRVLPERQAPAMYWPVKFCHGNGRSDMGILRLIKNWSAPIFVLLASLEVARLVTCWHSARVFCWSVCWLARRWAIAAHLNAAMSSGNAAFSRLISRVRGSLTIISSCLHTLELDASSTWRLPLSLATIADIKIGNTPLISFQSAPTL